MKTWLNKRWADRDHYGSVRKNVWRRLILFEIGERLGELRITEHEAGFTWSLFRWDTEKKGWYTLVTDIGEEHVLNQATIDAFLDQVMEIYIRLSDA